MSLTLSQLCTFKTGSDLSQITHFEVNYPDDFENKRGNGQK
ncbi:hypothetical protein [Escherichia coli]